MAILQIGLLLIGAAFFIGSFFITEKLSKEESDNIEKMSKEEIKNVIGKELESTTAEIEEILKDKMNDTIADMERRADKETNEDIMAISDYSNTVLESMNKSHEEIVFMYSALSEKMEKLTALTKDMQAMESSLKGLDAGISRKLDSFEEKGIEVNATAVEEVEFIPLVEDNESMLDKFDEFIEKEAVKEENESADTKKILDLYKSGKNEIEISKITGRGLGEIKLILGLFSDGIEPKEPEDEI